MSNDTVDAARWRIAMHYMTAHNRFIVEGLIPDELPDAAPQATDGTAVKGAVCASPSAQPAVAAPQLVHGVCRRIRDCRGCAREEHGSNWIGMRACYATAEEICQFVHEQRGVMDGQALLTGADEGSIPSVARPFDPNVRLYAALNLLEQVYDEMQLQGWAMDGQWATATKKVLDEHGWNA